MTKSALPVSGNPATSAVPLRYVALLRGVNVGGKNKIAMKSLAHLFSGVGCLHVQTYIQSGNIVFSADAVSAAKAATGLSAEIKKQFGFQTTILLRDQAEIERLEASSPYLKAGLPPDMLFVMFLADTPTEERLDLLDPARFDPDQFIVKGKEIFLYLPSGAARTKLTNAYFDSKLKTVSSSRNWRTVQKLLELMRNPVPIPSL